MVLLRKDIGSSYHLSATIDDAEQNITHVIRGEDMRDATAVHRVLQSLLGLPVPIYHFHPLLTESDGRKLAKRGRGGWGADAAGAGTFGGGNQGFGDGPLEPGLAACVQPGGKDQRDVKHEQQHEIKQAAEERDAV